MEKLVSVILSTYNEEKYLKKTIASILEQDYKNIEIVITDDGSTDSTIKILNEYSSDNRFNIVFEKHSGNIGFNLNSGIRRAKGEVIAILGADDIWMQNKLSIQLKYLENESIICSEGYVIDGEDNIVHNSVNNFKNKQYLTSEDLLLKNCILASSVVGYRSVFINNGLFDETNGSRSEDYYLWLNISTNCKFRYLDQRLVKYRVHGNNMSLKSMENIVKLHLRNIDIIREFCSQNINYDIFCNKGISIIYGKLSVLYFRNKDLNNSLKYCKMMLKIDKPIFTIRHFKYMMYYFFLKIKSLAI